MNWDGTTERREKATDHDNLIVMLNILTTLARNFELHVEDDKKNFKVLFRAYYIGLGAIGVINGLPALANAIKILYTIKGGT